MAAVRVSTAANVVAAFMRTAGGGHTEVLTPKLCSHEVDATVEIAGQPVLHSSTFLPYGRVESLPSFYALVASGSLGPGRRRGGFDAVFHDGRSVVWVLLALEQEKQTRGRGAGAAPVRHDCRGPPGSHGGGSRTRSDQRPLASPSLRHRRPCHHPRPTLWCRSRTSYCPCISPQARATQVPPRTQLGRDP